MTQIEIGEYLLELRQLATGDEDQRAPSVAQPSEGGEEKEMQMSPSEFERLLQKVRDAERLRRQRLREAERSRQRPVDKDW